MIKRLQQLLIPLTLVASAWMGVMSSAHAAADISEMGDIDGLRDPQFYIDIQKTTNSLDFLNVYDPLEPRTSASMPLIASSMIMSFCPVKHPVFSHCSARIDVRRNATLRPPLQPIQENTHHVRKQEDCWEIYRRYSINTGSRHVPDLCPVT
jgi:hypothetical protein